MSPAVPAATPTRLGPDERDAVRAAMARVLADGPWIGGPEVAGFEEEFAAYLGFGTAVGCASGTDALVLALLALGVGPGSRVLVSPHDGGYGAVATRLAGGEPVPMDLDTVALAPTPEQAEAGADGQPVAAIVVTHLHGDPVETEGLRAWATARGAALVEDCAQAHGCRPGGVHVGATADAAAFSFYPTKNLGAVGDGGAVVFADPDAAARARRLAVYGWGEGDRIDEPRGRNSRLDPMQAAILRARLPYLDARNRERRAVLDRYRDAAPGLRLFGDPASGVAHHAVARSPRRDALVAFLRDAGIGTGVHYRHLVTAMPGLGIPATALPVAEALVAEVVSLPCTPELTADEVARTVDALARWQEEERG